MKRRKGHKRTVGRRVITRTRLVAAIILLVPLIAAITGLYALDRSAETRDKETYVPISPSQPQSREGETPQQNSAPSATDSPPQESPAETTPSAAPTARTPRQSTQSTAQPTQPQQSPQPEPEPTPTPENACVGGLLCLPL